MYTTIKFIHVLTACMALGSTATYGIWFALVRKDPGHLGFVLKTLQILEKRFSTPSFILLGLSGLALVALAGLPWSTAWIWLSLGIFAVAAFVARLLVGPSLAKQVALLESHGPQSAEFQAQAVLSKKLGPLMGLLSLALLLLMVLKPTF